MYWLEALRIQLRMLFLRKQEAQRLDAELQYHLDCQVEENIASGMSAEEARYAALRSFGNPALMREQTRATWRWGWSEAIVRDLRYGRRNLARTPVFTAIVILILALGIGANTAVFSVMNAILMQLLPVSRAEGLSYVRMADGQGPVPDVTSTGNSTTSFSEAVFEALRNRSDVFEELISYAPLSFSGRVAVRHGELPEVAEGEEVSGNFFTGVGVRIARGRGFTLNDEEKHSPIAVLSYDFWTRSYVKDPAVVGQSIYVKGIPLTVVGVAAPGFHGVEPGSATDFWIPLQNSAELNAWGASFQKLYGSNWSCLRMMARLRSGVTPVQAQQSLTGTFGGVIRQTVGPVDPKQWKPLLDFVPVRGIAGFDEGSREPLRILMGLVALVLLIACTNVAMMLQARNTAREREFSVRLAIGADRTSVFRQLLTESLLLVCAGAVLGWAFAHWATRMLASWSEIETGLSPDRSVLLFTLTISAVAALIFGLIPLWSATHAPVAGVLRATVTGTTTSRSRILSGRIVLAGQMAICMVLLMAAMLLMRTLQNYATQDLGMQAQGLLVFGVTPQGQADPHVFYRTLLDRLRQTPGVESVSMADYTPGSGEHNSGDLILDGIKEPGATMLTNGAGPGFFHTMGVSVLAGRDFADSDVPNKQRVALVNETFVKRYLAHTNPLGHIVGGNMPDSTIVGVVRDSKYVSVDEEPTPTAYYASMQLPRLGTMHIAVRTRGTASAMLPELRKTVASIYPNVPLEQPMTQKQQFEESYASQRMFAAMGGFFGVLATLLVATGLYGTHSSRVSRRTTEIGVRMALGASRIQVLAMVLRESLWVLIGGLAAGIPLTFLAVRPLKSMLYQLSPFDPASFVLATGAMILVAGCAALIPARRAASIEPMRALRTE